MKLARKNHNINIFCGGGGGGSGDLIERKIFEIESGRKAYGLRWISVKMRKLWRDIFHNQKKSPKKNLARCGHLRRKYHQTIDTNIQVEFESTTNIIEKVFNNYFFKKAELGNVPDFTNLGNQNVSGTLKKPCFKSCLVPGTFWL